MRAASLSLLFVSIVCVACSNSDSNADRGGAKLVMRSADSSVVSRHLGAGDVRIVTTDGGVDLALIGDTISSGLSQQTLDKVRHDTDTGAVKGNGFGASIEKMVKGTVQSAIGTRVGFPLSAVRDARYESGKIEFDWSGKEQHPFGGTKVDKKPLMESFSAEDSQRFVDAVNARLKSRANM